MGKRYNAFLKGVIKPFQNLTNAFKSARYVFLTIQKAKTLKKAWKFSDYHKTDKKASSMIRTPLKTVYYLTLKYYIWSTNFFFFTQSCSQGWSGGRTHPTHPRHLLRPQVPMPIRVRKCPILEIIEHGNLLRKALLTFWKGIVTPSYFFSTQFDTYRLSQFINVSKYQNINIA